MEVSLTGAEIELKRERVAWPLLLGRALHDLWSPWPKARSFSQLCQRMTALDQDGSCARGFFVLQGVVTPNIRRIAKGLFIPDWVGPGR